MQKYLRTSQSSHCENTTDTTEANLTADDNQQPEPPFPISNFLWFHSLQELPKENSKFNTLAKHFPKIWNMMTIIFKYWKDTVKW